MLKEKLKKHKIILASGSPRRQDFFTKLDIDFTIDVREVEEVFDDSLKREAITDYLSQLKANAFQNISEKEIIVTSDTIVWKDGKAIGKPKDAEDATRMLRSLSNAMHEVFTSVTFTTAAGQTTVNDTTKVWFKKLTNEEITFYITTCIPFDKAGSYGIQDWLGYIGIEKIEGCFFNVMGLPTRKVYEGLIAIANNN
ncbi:Maf family nucleotide pyrophosphatase [Patiriisocius sp. Uisw_047]|jgi:septum formation protein|uniref:Maf family nucleotide pyrophosphatase n=1 Tax=Patiriisocius sp. Uisw_047 TaxID=3230969 RepID=UPI0039EAB593